MWHEMYQLHRFQNLLNKDMLDLSFPVCTCLVLLLVNIEWKVILTSPITMLLHLFPVRAPISIMYQHGRLIQEAVAIYLSYREIISRQSLFMTILITLQVDFQIFNLE